MSGETILVLEDNLVTMKALKSGLCSAGYQVVGAATTNEALDILRVWKPDLMILDVTLLAEDPFNGVCDGLAFKAWMGNLFPGIDIPIIVYTGNNSPALAARAWSCGISWIVRKGAGLSVLLDVIRQVLDERRLKQTG